MPVTRSNFITRDESEFIRFQLTAKGKPREVKAGLQRLCANYERGRRLADPQEHRLLVRGLLWDENTTAIVRRWSYKAVALLGGPQDSGQLIQRLKTETDIENQTWGMAAVVALSKDADLHDVCSQAGLNESAPLVLAARLFADPRWLQLNREPPIINIDREESLTLKWAALLVGYGRAPINMFHPQFENRAVLGKLNEHPAPEVSEYSVWALWQNPTFEVSDMGISLLDIQKRPENVRRWINRLVTKDPAFVEGNLDLFDELRRDGASVAREGLALGIRESYIPGLDRRVLLWHENEDTEFVRDLLLEHMARSADRSVDYGDLVEQSYGAASRNGGLRQRLLAASRGTTLYQSLRRIDIIEEARAFELALPHAQSQIKVQGNLIMGNQTNFNAGGNIQGQNLVGGDMIGSANQAVQTMSNVRRDEQAALANMLDFAKTSAEISHDQKARIAGAVEAVAKDDSKSSKGALLDSLKWVAGGVAAMSSAATQIDKFVEIVSKWL